MRVDFPLFVYNSEFVSIVKKHSIQINFIRRHLEARFFLPAKSRLGSPLVRIGRMEINASSSNLKSNMSRERSRSSPSPCLKDSASAHKLHLATDRFPTKLHSSRGQVQILFAGCSVDERRSTFLLISCPSVNAEWNRRAISVTLVLTGEISQTSRPSNKWQRLLTLPSTI